MRSVIQERGFIEENVPSIVEKQYYSDKQIKSNYLVKIFF